MRRVAVLGVVLAALWLFGAMLLTAKRLNDDPGDGTAAVHLAPSLALFEARRTGSVTELTPKAGALVVLAGFPLLLGGLAYAVERRRHA